MIWCQLMIMQHVALSVIVLHIALCWNMLYKMSCFPSCTPHFNPVLSLPLRCFRCPGACSASAAPPRDLLPLFRSALCLRCPGANQASAASGALNASSAGAHYSVCSVINSCHISGFLVILVLFFLCLLGFIVRSQVFALGSNSRCTTLSSYAPRHP